MLAARCGTIRASAMPVSNKNWARIVFVLVDHVPRSPEYQPHELFKTSRFQCSKCGTKASRVDFDDALLDKAGCSACVDDLRELANVASELYETHEDILESAENRSMYYFIQGVSKAFELEDKLDSYIMPTQDLLDLFCFVYNPRDPDLIPAGGLVLSWDMIEFARDHEEIYELIDKMGDYP